MTDVPEPDLRVVAILVWARMIEEGRAGPHVPYLIQEMQKSILEDPQRYPRSPDQTT